MFNNIIEYIKGRKVSYRNKKFQKHRKELQELLKLIEKNLIEARRLAWQNERLNNKHEEINKKYRN